MPSAVLVNGLVQGLTEKQKNFQYVDLILIRGRFNVKINSHASHKTSDTVYEEQLKAALAESAPSITYAEAMHSLCLWHKDGPVESRTSGVPINNNRNVLRWEGSVRDTCITLYSFRVPMVQPIAGMATVYTTTASATSLPQHPFNALSYSVEQTNTPPKLPIQTFGPCFATATDVQNSKSIQMWGTLSGDELQTTLIIFLG